MGIMGVRGEVNGGFATHAHQTPHRQLAVEAGCVGEPNCSNARVHTSCYFCIHTQLALGGKRLARELIHAKEWVWDSQGMGANEEYYM